MVVERHYPFIPVGFELVGHLNCKFLFFWLIHHVTQSAQNSDVYAYFFTGIGVVLRRKILQSNDKSRRRTESRPRGLVPWYLSVATLQYKWQAKYKCQAK